MKTIFRLLCGWMAIALTTACSHEELLQTEPVQKPAEGKIVSVKAYTPSEQPASRLAFDDQGTEGLKLSWSEGDAFTAVVGNSKVTFTYDANTKEFSGTLPDDATLTDGVNAYYPAYDGESFEMDLSQQTGALNSATTYMEGAYDATAQAFRFTHSTAILKVAFSGLPQNAEIESISVNVISVGNTFQITFSNAANSLYINLPALAKGSKLVFYVETTAGLYTSTQTVTVDAGIEVGKFYVASIVLEEATVGHLPGYSMTDKKNYFNEAVKNFLNNNPSLTKIKFIANSNNTNKDYRIGTSEPYMVAGSDNTLEIHTAAAEFVFNADCSGMFYNLTKIQSIDFGNCVKTGGVTDMYYMFATCKALTSLDLWCFDTAVVNDMSQMFLDCSSLTSLNVSSFNTSSVTDMSSMFFGCSKLTSLDLFNFNTSKVTTMNGMFYECLALTVLDLRYFNFKNVTDFDDMFYALGRDAAVQPVYIYVKDEKDKAKLDAAPIGIANYSYAEIHIK